MNKERAEIGIVCEHEAGPDDSHRLALAFDMLLAELDCTGFGGKVDLDSDCPAINDPSKGLLKSGEGLAPISSQQ